MINFKISFFLILLTGCTVGPKYEPPVISLPEEWHASPCEGTTAESPDCFVWWKSFNDPQLDALIEEASRQNLDLFIAGMRLQRARLERKGKKADLYPHVDGSATAGHLYWSKEALTDGILKPGGCQPNHRGNRNINLFEIGFDADWEIDLWGLTKHEVKGIEAKIESVEAENCDLWVTLCAEIARNYIELRGLQARSALAMQSIQIAEEKVHLTEQLLSIDFASSIDLFQVEEQLAVLRAQKPVLDLEIDKTIHRLSILQANEPSALFCELSEPKKLPQLPCEIPIGLPSDLLRRRPDIRKMERNLAAATESVGSAVAALFPRISLYGFFGQVSTQLHSLTSSSGTSWFAAPQLLFPIFNSRLLTQDVKMNQLRAREALFEYQKSVMTALEEVENALASLRTALEQQEQLSRASEINHESYHLTLQLYERGIKDYLGVLTAKNAWLQSEDRLVQLKTELLLHYISLYKALGGGWDISQPSRR